MPNRGKETGKLALGTDLNTIDPDVECVVSGVCNEVLKSDPSRTRCADGVDNILRPDPGIASWDKTVIDHQEHRGEITYTRGCRTDVGAVSIGTQPNFQTIRVK